MLKKKRQNLLRKKTLNLNGSDKVYVKTIHGMFDFKLQRFISKDKDSNFTYFTLTNQFTYKGESKGKYLSKKLNEFIFQYCNKLSYKDVSLLMKLLSGKSLLSPQGIHNVVSHRANKLSDEISNETNKLLNNDNSFLPEIISDFDIYDKSTKEVLYFEDCIQVKKQKEQRDCQPKLNNKRINTDLALLKKEDGIYDCIIDNLDDNVSFCDIVKSRFIKYNGKCSQSVNFLAITDGAKSIRNHLKNIFNCDVRIILDWYHLNKKLYELLSMISINKTEKGSHLSFLVSNLWKGKVDICLDYLSKINYRNSVKLYELVGYLTKHKTEIINYELRSSVGKCIGSGRMEKCVDLVIGKRQKRKGMSWSKSGSRSLGLLKTNEINLAA